MIKKFFKNLINKKENQESNANSIKAVAECPICGNKVLENGDTWGCIGVLSGDCHFSMNNRLNGKKIDINTLIKYKQMDEFKHIQAIIQGAQKVKEDTYNQHDRVEINKVQETQATQVTQEVQEVQEVQETRSVQEKVNQHPKKSKSNNNDFFKKARKLKYRCSCGSDVYRYAKLVKCSNPNCGFEIKTEYHGKNFSDIQMAQLIAHRISHVETFTNAFSKEVFKGRVFIDFDDNYNLIPKYKYVSNLNTLDEKYKNHLFAPDKGTQTEIPLSTLFNNKSKKNSKKTSTYNSESNNANNNNDSIKRSKDNESYEEKYYRRYDEQDYCSEIYDYKKSCNNNYTNDDSDFDANNQFQRDELYRQSLEQEDSYKKNDEADEYELYRRINNEDSQFYEENNEYDSHQFYTDINDDDEPF